ncbi:unnamed protein product [Moneuplotes crassus]|uniref:Uncharacterized protein n=1 Tax=Euplotes crassus TaxID=5936 RepID=A0AAD2D580_EUPCR|nr:unnamed protein product [Moneuplotes crassus]
MESKEADSKSNGQIGENSSQLKTLYFKSISTNCAKHDLPFKGLQRETNILMCEECLKNVEKKDNESILPIFTAREFPAETAQDEPESRNLKTQDYISKKKQEADTNLTNFFKSIHEILYDIEGRKLQEVDEKIKDAFGRNLNFSELQRTIKVLQEKSEKVKKRIDKDEFHKIVSKKDEYQDLINDSDNVILDAQVYLEKTSSLGPDWNKDFINIFGLDIALEELIREYIRFQN